MKTYCVIIPTYNEAKNIEPLIESIQQQVAGLGILVVDDNSPDGTSDVVRTVAMKYRNIKILSRNKKEGLGRAYLHAFSEILKDPTVEKIITMDADFSHDPSYLKNMIDRSKTHDVVIGSRYIVGGGVKNWGPWRRVLSTFANFYCRVVTGMPIKDSTSGFMIITKSFLLPDVMREVNLSGYAFSMMLKHSLWKRAASISEVPIIFKNRREGKSKLSAYIVVQGMIAPWKMVYNSWLRKSKLKK